MPSPFASRRQRRFLIAMLCVAAGLAVLPHLLARAVRVRSLQLVQEVAGPQGRVDLERVEVRLLAGDITWTGLRIAPGADSGHAAAAPVAGSVDRIAVRGLSIWELLVAQRIEMRALAVSGARLQFAPGQAEQEGEASRPASRTQFRHFRADSLLVDRSAISWRGKGPAGPEATVPHLALRAQAVRAEMPQPHRPFSLTFASASAALDSLHLGLPPLYDLGIAKLRLHYPDSVLALHGIALSARKGPHEYRQVLPYETDLTTFTSDSIGLRGLDLAALFSQGALRAGELRISSTRLQDYRDKTMPDAPFKDKPMPARLLRSLPFPVCLDSLVVDRLDVAYFEKDSLTPDYGSVEFTGISAVAHGLCTLHPEEAPELHLAATATVFGNAPVRFDFRTAVFDSSDHFSVKARIGPLPFRVFNAMTNDLLLVRATAGTIGGIDYTFEANRNRGRGRVDMEYDGLELRIARRDGSRERDKLKTFLANSLLRSRNLRESGQFRHGDFTVERVKDKQVFNYLWRGLREGMLETALPGVLKSAREAGQGDKGKASAEGGG